MALLADGSTFTPSSGQAQTGLLLSGVASPEPPDPPAPPLPSVVATIGYGPVHANGGFQPENPANLAGTTISTSIFVALVITEQVGTISRVDWYTQLAGGEFVLRRDDDLIAPYNPKSGTAGVDIGWWSNASNGTITLRARVVFTDGFQDVDATFTVTGNPPTTTNLGTSLGPYLTQAGGQTLVMADGDYTISDFAQPATQRTSWLILKAQNPHGVKIVPSGTTAAAHVGTWTHLNKVLFVGIDFQDVRVNLDGCEDVKFWYADMTYPGTGLPESTPPIQSPQAVQFDAGGVNPWRFSDRCGIYGSDLHHFGDDGVELKRANNTELVGCRIRDLQPPYSSWHDDATQTAGRGTGFTIADCWITGRSFWAIEALFNTKENVIITVRDSWVNDSPGVGFHCVVKEDASHPTATARLTVNRTNVKSWDHTGADTLKGGRTDLITINDVNYTTTAGVGTDPATAWKAANPYDTYSTYLGI